ncbi:hypothetical protein [Flavobacterium sp. J27]|uniref:hypothetical protein n=1 Tax=Flavobacterium sp. J27 TaxID=2060419 RepID=UPI00102FA72E|nr:hypothetical protein [Flavobacterium sp. J27]
MKRVITYWFVFLALLLFVTTCSISCCSKRVAEEKKVEIKKDSLVQDTNVKQVVEISKAIKDSSSHYMPDLKTGKGKECDSLCNEKYREALKAINFYKKSGANSYQMFYDEKTKFLYTIAEMQATINMKTDSISKLKKVQHNTKETVKVVERKVYPKWLVALAVLGTLFIVFIGYRISLIFKPEV